jgi:thioesterase domain-containing protein
VSRLTKETRYRFYLRNWERLHRLSKKYQFSLPQFMHNTSFETFSALKDYQGQRVPVRMTLIRASDSREVPGAAPSCGWDQIAEKGVEVLWAPGDHETMFAGEHLKVTSEIVRRGLAAAAAGDSQTSTGSGQDASQIRGVLHVDCPST